MGKLIQLIGIILFFSVGLSGSEDISSKKRAYFSVRQPSILRANEMAQEEASRLEMTSLNVKNPGPEDPALN